jgi:hypothetical protein
MRYLSAILLSVMLISGCTPISQWGGQSGQPEGYASVYYDNPALLGVADHHMAWETVVDVMDDYFVIQREEPVRLIGNTPTEGRLDTFPKVGATIFEPWLHDSANSNERLESTLQSIRRRAVVRVRPAEHGYWVDVSVFKELEDVIRPERSTAGAATFRYDDTLTRVATAVGEQEINEGWIPQGRDTALEQRIIAQLKARCPQAWTVGGR